MTIFLSVAEKFPEVAGVKKEDSQWSAENLRKQVILPKYYELMPDQKLVITIDEKVSKLNDNRYLYGASYLKEAFVGLVSYGDISYEDFMKKIFFKCHNKESEFYISCIYRYLKEYEEK